MLLNFVPFRTSVTRNQAFMLCWRASLLSIVKGILWTLVHGKKDWCIKGRWVLNCYFFRLATSRLSIMPTLGSIAGSRQNGSLFVWIVLYLFLNLSLRVRVFGSTHNNLSGCNVLQFCQCIQGENSYWDGNSHTGGSQSLVLTYAWHKKHTISRIRNTRLATRDRSS